LRAAHALFTAMPAPVRVAQVEAALAGATVA
jgi:hypothetical protein